MQQLINFRCNNRFKSELCFKTVQLTTFWHQQVFKNAKNKANIMETKQIYLPKCLFSCWVILLCSAACERVCQCVCCSPSVLLCARSGPNPWLTSSPALTSTARRRSRSPASGRSSPSSTGPKAIRAKASRATPAARSASCCATPSSELQSGPSLCPRFYTHQLFIKVKSLFHHHLSLNCWLTRCFGKETFLTFLTSEIIIHQNVN